jgi:cytochrome bd-type quinol oxidase subunit 2
LPYLPWFTFLRWYAYLPSMGVSLAVAACGADLLRRITETQVRRTAATAAVAIWLASSAMVLHFAEERERRAGERVEMVTAALLPALRPAKPATVFVLSVGKRRAGGSDSVAGRSVLLSG